MARNGARSGAIGTPMTYLLDGRQYIALTVGGGPRLVAFALPNQRTVLSFRRVAAAISRRLCPVASISATEASAGVRSSAEATRTGSMWGGRVDQQHQRGGAQRAVVLLARRRMRW